MSSQILLSGGDKWYSYSGIVFGDVSVPASISMVLIPNTGLKDSLIQVLPYFGKPTGSGTGDQLGLELKIDDVTVVKAQQSLVYREHDLSEGFNLFVPRQSKLEILSINTSNNNTQERGVNVLGYYL